MRPFGVARKIQRVFSLRKEIKSVGLQHRFYGKLFSAVVVSVRADRLARIVRPIRAVAVDDVAFGDYVAQQFFACGNRFLAP